MSVASATALTDELLDVELEPAERLGASDEPAGDEHHRRGDHRRDESPRDRRVGEEQGRDHDEVGRRASLASVPDLDLTRSRLGPPAPAIEDVHAQREHPAGNASSIQAKKPTASSSANPIT